MNFKHYISQFWKVSGWGEGLFLKAVAFKFCSPVKASPHVPAELSKWATGERKLHLRALPLRDVCGCNGRQRGPRTLHYSRQFKMIKTWYIHIYILVCTRIHYVHIYISYVHVYNIYTYTYSYVHVYIIYT